MTVIMESKLHQMDISLVPLLYLGFYFEILLSSHQTKSAILSSRASSKFPGIPHLFLACLPEFEFFESKCAALPKMYMFPSQRTPPHNLVPIGAQRLDKDSQRLAAQTKQGRLSNKQSKGKQLQCSCAQ